MSNETKKITVIIPVYNTALYLQDSINSVVRQSYQNIEVIIIDDGSTDDSQIILRDYAQKDSRIKLFTKSNGGPSSARNLGLMHMTGDYLLFLDSDDKYVDSRAFEQLLNIAEHNNIDMLMFHYSRDEEKSYNSNQIKHLSTKVYKGTELTKIFFDLEFYIWNTFYKSSFIKQYNYRFVESQYYEDIAWLAFYRLRASQITALPKIIINYTKNPRSTVSTMKNPYQIIDAYYQLQNDNQLYLSNDLVLQKYCLLYSCYLIKIHLAETVKQCGFTKILGTVKQLKVYLEVFNNIQVNQTDFKLFNSNLDNQSLMKTINFISFIRRSRVSYLMIYFCIKKIIRLIRF